MPMKGGRPVVTLKTGTNMRRMSPRMRMVVPWGSIVALAIFSPSGVSLMNRERRMREATRQARLGRKRCSMTFAVESCPPIHSIVVVTSPMGVQAPPAFAAMTMAPP